MKFTTTKTRLFVLLSIATSVLIMTSCTSSNKKNDWKHYNLSRKVKSFKQTTYYAEEKFGKIEKGDISKGYDMSGMRKRVQKQNDGNKLVIFNPKGNRIEKTKYDSDGDLDYKTLYKYDKQGNRIEESKYNSDAELQYKELYDKRGNLIEVIGYNVIDYILSNGHISRQSFRYKKLYEYDEDENLVEVNKYHSNGKILYNALYEYDEDGNVIKENEYDYNWDDDERLTRKTLNKYDEDGNVIEKSKYDYKERLESKTLYKYDEQGNVIDEYFHGYDGGPGGDLRYNTETLYEYDGDGNLIEWNWYSNGDLLDNIIYKYDENGNCVEIIANKHHWKDTRDEYKYEYEFDNNGNWINRLGFKNNIPKEITEREIEYFD